MYYEFDIPVETSNLISNKKKVVLPIAYGIITAIGITFPAGCAGTVHISINHGLNQIFPSNQSGTVKGDNVNIQGDMFHGVLSEPYELVAYGYNVGANFNHTVIIRIWQKRVWQLNPFSDQMFMLSNNQGESLGI